MAKKNKKTSYKWYNNVIMSNNKKSDKRYLIIVRRGKCIISASLNLKLLFRFK